MCTKCRSGYYRQYDDGKYYCLQITDQCNQNNDQNKCTGCESNYAINEQEKCIEAPYCKRISNAGVCIECANGYEVSSDQNRCYNQGCQSLTCLPGYYDTKGNPNRTNTGSNCQIITENCNQGTNINECQGCKEGYFLNSEKKCESKLNNCLQQQNHKCIVCEPGYYISSSSCYQIMEYCVKGSKKDGCEQCDQGYHLYYHEAYGTYSCEKIHRYCIKGNSINSCMRCSDQFYLSEDFSQCLDSQVRFCEVALGPSLCLKCQPGYYMKSPS